MWWYGDEYYFRYVEKLTQRYKLQDTSYLSFHRLGTLWLHQLEGSHGVIVQPTLSHCWRCVGLYFPFSTLFLHSVWFRRNTANNSSEWMRTIHLNCHLVILQELHQFQSVPSFLNEVNIFPLITSIANLCSNLDETPLVGEYCRYPISNSTTIIVCSSEPQKFSPFSKPKVSSIKWVNK